MAIDGLEDPMAEAVEKACQVCVDTALDLRGFLPTLEMIAEYYHDKIAECQKTSSDATEYLRIVGSLRSYIIDIRKTYGLLGETDS